MELGLEFIALCTAQRKFERLLALAEEEEEFVEIDGDDFDKLGL